MRHKGFLMRFQVGSGFQDGFSILRNVLLPKECLAKYVPSLDPEILKSIVKHVANRISWIYGCGCRWWNGFEWHSLLDVFFKLLGCVDQLECHLLHEMSLSRLHMLHVLSSQCIETWIPHSLNLKHKVADLEGAVHLQTKHGYILIWIYEWNIMGSFMIQESP